MDTVTASDDILDGELIEYATVSVDELAALRAARNDGAATMLILGVVLQMLLSTTGGEQVEISHEALTRAPGVLGWRDPGRQAVILELAA